MKHVKCFSYKDIQADNFEKHFCLNFLNLNFNTLYSLQCSGQCYVSLPSSVLFLDKTLRVLFSTVTVAFSLSPHLTNLSTTSNTLTMRNTGGYKKPKAEFITRKVA